MLFPLLLSSLLLSAASAQSTQLSVSIYSSGDCSGNTLGGGPLNVTPGTCRTVPGISGVSFQGTCESGAGGGGRIVACRSSDCTGTCSPSTSFSSGQCFSTLPGFPDNSVKVACITDNGGGGGGPGNGASGINTSILVAVTAAGMAAIAARLGL